MSYNTQEMSEFHVSSKIDRTALKRDTLLILISFGSKTVEFVKERCRAGHEAFV